MFLNWRAVNRFGAPPGHPKQSRLALPRRRPLERAAIRSSRFPTDLVLSRRPRRRVEGRSTGQRSCPSRRAYGAPQEEGAWVSRSATRALPKAAEHADEVMAHGVG